MCVDESLVLYAAPSGSTTSSCTQTAPCSIDRAFAISDNTRNTIKLAGGAYAASLTVSNKRINLYASGATISSASGNTIIVSDAAALSIEGGTIVNSSGSLGAVAARSENNVDVPELVLRGVSIQSTRYVPLYLLKAKATLVECSVQSGDGAAVVAVASSMASIDRSSLSGTSHVVTVSDSSTVRLTNSIVGGTAGSDAFFALDGAVVVSFSTVIDGIATCPNVPAVCGGTGAKGVCFDNSIVANLTSGAPSNTITGQACTATYTLVFPQSTALAGAGNKNNVNPKFKNPSAGDLHLDTGSPAIDAANPTATLGVDHEGKSRPQGAQRDLGAFEYP